jgi:deoxyribodipyrimidine photo-lyase
VPYAGGKMLCLFFRTKSRNTHLGIANPLEEGAEASEKRSRAMVYNEERDRADRDTTSRLRYNEGTCMDYHD